jgi:signal transduction histidine kinase
VRTPLNVVVLGVDLLKDKIEEIASRLSAIVYRDCCGVVTDVKKMCRDLVEIMDNLSIYEKIMGNALSLLMLMHPVKSTIEEIVAPFYAQVCLYFSLFAATVFFTDAPLLAFFSG